jgi:hypothetical protein
MLAMSSEFSSSEKCAGFSLQFETAGFESSKPPASKSGFEIRPIQKTTPTKKKEIESFCFEMCVILSTRSSRPDARGAN